MLYILWTWRQNTKNDLPLGTPRWFSPGLTKATESSEICRTDIDTHNRHTWTFRCVCKLYFKPSGRLSAIDLTFMLIQKIQASLKNLICINRIYMWPRGRTTNLSMRFKKNIIVSFIFYYIINFIIISSAASKMPTKFCNYLK